MKMLRKDQGRTLETLRKNAIGAARFTARQMGLSPETMFASEALKMLDDLNRTQPLLLASMWYRKAGENQIKLFKKEWHKHA
jgi:hypothetical protein